MAIHNDYERSSEGAVRHWEFPYARLENVTPLPSEPFAVLSLLPGTQLTGVVLTIDAVNTIIVGDVTCSMVTLQNIRNVLTYAGNVEATWGPINIGDPIYYDRSATMPADCFLSTSPADNVAGANALFGFAVPGPLAANWDTDIASFPYGAALVASTQRLCVMQVGAGAH
jgi:hypothetical protein